MKNVVIVRPQNATPRYTLLQGLYWMAYCILVSFSSVYLLDRGFSNTQIGVLVGVSSVLSALMQPLAAGLAAKSKRLTLRHWSALLALAMLAASSVLLLLPGKAVQAVCYMFLLVVLQVLTPFTYSLGMECVNNNVPLNYGVARSAGSISYAAASSVCGMLAKRFGAGTIPILLLVMTAALIPGYLTFRFREPKPGEAFRTETMEAKKSGDEAPFLKKYFRLLPLLAGIVLLFISHNILMAFPYQIVQRLGGDSPEMGIMLTVVSLVEIPVMVCFSFLLHRASSRFWVMISGISFFLHAGVMWLAPNFSVLYIAQVFEATGYALYTVAVVYFVNDLVEPRDRVKGQAWFAMTNTVGILLGTSVGGVLLDRIGAGGLLCFATLTAGGGMVLLFILLLGKNTQRERGHSLHRFVLHRGCKKYDLTVQ